MLGNLVFSPDGSQVSTSYNGSVYSWRSADGTFLGSVGSFDADAFLCARSSDGSRFAVGGQTWIRAQMLGLPGGAPVGSFGNVGGGMGKPAFSPDGSIVATAAWTNEQGCTAFWRASDGSFISIVGVCPGQGAYWPLQWVSNSTLLFSANGLYALDYPTLTYRQIGTDAPTEIGASIDGSLAWYCGGSTGFGCLRTSDMSKIWSDTSGGDSWAAFWPDDSRILLNGNLTVRSTTDFGVQATWGAHQAELYPQLGGVSGVAQSPSAGFLASSGVDCLKFWDPSTGELTRTVTSADGAFCMAVSPDASLVATGSAYPKWGGRATG